MASISAIRICKLAERPSQRNGEAVQHLKIALKADTEMCVFSTRPFFTLRFTWVKPTPIFKVHVIPVRAFNIANSKK